MATPIYKLRKEKKISKADVLVDHSQVSVVGPMDLNQSTASVASSSNVSLDDSSVLNVLVRSQNVSYISVATPALSVFLNGPPQKKGVSPSVDSEDGLIKPVKDVFL